MFKAKVVNTEKIAWNMMKVYLEGADFKMVIELNNPEDFDDYVKGETVSVEVESVEEEVEE